MSRVGQHPIPLFRNPTAGSVDSTKARLNISFHIALTAARRAPDERRQSAKNAPDGSDHGSSRGFALGLGAYALWGVLPIYFKPLADLVRGRHRRAPHPLVAAVPGAADRCLARLGRRYARAGRSRRRSASCSLTALLIGVNWLLYVYAVTSGHILAASFGYYLNPLANVLLGRFVLKERLTRLQWLAVAIAAAGISVLAAGALGQLWISLTLCVSFALYGLLRKIVQADAMTGLASKPRSCSRSPSPGSPGATLRQPAVRPTIARDQPAASSPASSRPPRCCCSPPPPGGWPIRRSACSSSSRRRCSS